MSAEHTQEDRGTELKEALRRSRQEHLLQQAASWSLTEQRSLQERMSQVDWEELARGHEETVPTRIEPSRVVSLAERSRRTAELTEIGRRAYQAGEVAVIMVAGGQGTRLGFPGPKGCYPIGPLSQKTVYQYHAERFLSLLEHAAGSRFLIMTSPATDEETRAFFAEHGNFGVAEKDICFFRQDTVPSLDMNGKALLAERGKLLENPDGHGGCFTALVKQGILEDLHQSGIRHLVYIQVDNVLAPMYDPELIGLAIAEKADVITKVVEKTDPAEKVGLLVQADGADYLLEYIHLTPEQAGARAADGKLELRWGNTAMHYWSVDFFRRKAAAGFQLPLHRSKKPLKVWADGAAREVEGFKHERFIFDLLPEANVSIGLEVDRRQEFAPLKNADGPDSPRTVHELCGALYRSWLSAAGVTVAPGATIEISPRYASDKEMFLQRWDRSVKEVREDLYLER